MESLLTANIDPRRGGRRDAVGVSRRTDALKRRASILPSERDAKAYIAEMATPAGIDHLRSTREKTLQEVNRIQNMLHSVEANMSTKDSNDSSLDHIRQRLGDLVDSIDASSKRRDVAYRKVRSDLEGIQANTTSIDALIESMDNDEAEREYLIDEAVEMVGEAQSQLIALTNKLQSLVLNRGNVQPDDIEKMKAEMQRSMDIFTHAAARVVAPMQSGSKGAAMSSADQPHQQTPELCDKKLLTTSPARTIKPLINIVASLPAAIPLKTTPSSEEKEEAISSRVQEIMAGLTKTSEEDNKQQQVRRPSAISAGGDKQANPTKSSMNDLRRNHSRRASEALQAPPAIRESKEVQTSPMSSPTPALKETPVKSEAPGRDEVQKWKQSIIEERRSRQAAEQALSALRHRLAQALQRGVDIAEWKNIVLTSGAELDINFTTDTPRNATQKDYPGVVAKQESESENISTSDMVPVLSASYSSGASRTLAVQEAVKKMLDKPMPVTEIEKVIAWYERQLMEATGVTHVQQNHVISPTKATEQAVLMEPSASSKKIEKGDPVSSPDPVPKELPITAPPKPPSKKSKGKSTTTSNSTKIAQELKTVKPKPSVSVACQTDVGFADLHAAREEAMKAEKPHASDLLRISRPLSTDCSTQTSDEVHHVQQDAKSDKIADTSALALAITNEQTKATEDSAGIVSKGSNSNDPKALASDIVRAISSDRIASDPQITEEALADASSEVAASDKVASPSSHTIDSYKLRTFAKSTLKGIEQSLSLASQLIEQANEGCQTQLNNVSRLEDLNTRTNNKSLLLDDLKTGTNQLIKICTLIEEGLTSADLHLKEVNSVIQGGQQQQRMVGKRNVGKTQGDLAKELQSLGSDVATHQTTLLRLISLFDVAWKNVFELLVKHREYQNAQGGHIKAIALGFQEHGGSSTDQVPYLPFSKIKRKNKPQHPSERGVSDTEEDDGVAKDIFEPEGRMVASSRICIDSNEDQVVEEPVSTISAEDEGQILFFSILSQTGFYHSSSIICRTIEDLHAQFCGLALEHISYDDLKAKLEILQMQCTRSLQKVRARYQRLHERWQHWRKVLLEERNLSGGDADSSLLCPICGNDKRTPPMGSPTSFANGKHSVDFLHHSRHFPAVKSRQVLICASHTKQHQISTSKQERIAFPPVKGKKAGPPH